LEKSTTTVSVAFCPAAPWAQKISTDASKLAEKMLKRGGFI
jgi:hypothetical protein